MAHHFITSVENNRRENAEIILNDILSLSMPSESLLLRNYNPAQISGVQSKIEDFFRFIRGEARSAEDPVQIFTRNIYDFELVQKKQGINNDFVLQGMKTKLNKFRMPSDFELDYLFGDYSSVVNKHFRAFNSLNKKRNCTLPYVAHLVRSAMMARALDYDNGSGKNSFYYVALAGIHDSPEDLFRSLRSGKKPKYKLNELDKFYEHFVPSELRDDVSMLSNFADGIMKELVFRKFNINNVSSLNQGLSVLESELSDGELLKTVKLMKEKVPSRGFSNPVDFFEDVKFLFYRDVYLDNLANTAIDNGKLIKYEFKGVTDMLDNLVSVVPRNYSAKVKTVKKTFEWYDNVDRIVNNFSDSSYLRTFKDRADQMLLFANYSAKNVAIEFLSQGVEKQDYSSVIIDDLKDMRHVLYSNLKK